ncbi:MAG: S49 family peptidase [Gammaproteobacteria bacterium]
MGWDNPEADSPPRPPSMPPGGDTDFERRLTERLSFEFLREQRRARRWGIFFKLLAFAYVSVFVVLSLPPTARLNLTSKPYTALVDVQGIIMHGSEAGADNVVKGLRAAFEDGSAAGVIMRINSPGGSPVQAGYINDEIYRLREEYPDTPLYAVIEDICASGGYYVAVAAERIYADKASIVGSIGVRMDGFGFVESMDKLGIERRLLTAGENKAFLDPFSPLSEAHVDHVRGILGEVHQQFINTVLKGRRDRLSADAELFSGLIWSGEQSLALGLIDEFGSAGYVAREVLGAERIVDFTVRDNSLIGLIRRGGVALLEGAANGAVLGW